jgi:hypothetical protein
MIAEVIPADEWEQREIYAKLGVAVYLCQCLESQLVNYVVALHAISGNVVTRDELDVIFAELLGNTLGRNLRNAVRMLGDDEAVYDELASVLTLRNDLVHHWMRERALDQGTSEKRRVMVHELHSAIEQLEAADARLVERTQGLLEQRGVSPTVIQAEYERLRTVAAGGNSENFMRDFEVVTKARRE